MGTRVVVAGAGGFGRGVYAWLEQSQTHRSLHKVSEVVFIDDGIPAVLPQAPVVSSIAEYEPAQNDAVLCAIGVPAVRQRVVEYLRSRGARFHTFVDDRAVIGSNVKFGEGVIVCPGTVISSDTQLERHVHVNFNCSIGHDVQVGEFTTLSPTVNIMGEVRIGRGVFLGGSAAVLPRVDLADQVVVGAGAVVVRAETQAETLVGNPARRLPWSGKQAGGEAS